jgi:uncharacterized membrane protein YGL010W
MTTKKSSPEAVRLTTGPYARLAPHFAFYNAYHTNHVNQWIHICCVPLILATFFALFHHYVPLDKYISDPAVHNAIKLTTGASFSLSTIALAVYTLFYLYLTPSWVGVTAAILVNLCFHAGMTLIDVAGPNAMAIAGGINAVAWILQFYGHGVHEKRAPALLDNLTQVRIVWQPSRSVI